LQKEIRIYLILKQAEFIVCVIKLTKKVTHDENTTCFEFLKSQLFADIHSYLGLLNTENDINSDRKVFNKNIHFYLYKSV